MKEEIWEDIPGFDGNYQVSTLGRVRSVDREVAIMYGCSIKSCKGRILKPKKDSNGFNYVFLFLDGIRVKRQVQRLVAITFLENPNGYDYVRFKDDDRDNMALENLEWTNEKCRVATIRSDGSCPRCSEKLRNFGRVNYCWCCGKEIRWV